MLRFVLIASIAFSFSLGAFALAGERLGLWEPVELAAAPKPMAARGKHQPNEASRLNRNSVLAGASLNASTRTRERTVRPPLPAKTAFLIAALSSLVMAATFVGVRAGPRAGLDHVSRRFDPRSGRAASALSGVGVSVTYLALIPAAALLGWLVARVVNAP
jgi:hypothetical protein